MLATLITTSAMMTSARTVVISLIRRGTRPGSCLTACQLAADPDGADGYIWLGRGEAEHVPDAAQGVDQPRFGAVHLTAEHGHIRLDDPGVAAEVVVPHMVENLHLGQHPVRVAHEVAQQLELGGGKLHRLPGAPHFVAVLVEFQVGELQPGRRLGTVSPGATEPGPDRGDAPLRLNGLVT